MECNRLCSLCSTNPAHKFCICSNLPLLCTSCRPNHETKPGFHFALPMAGFDYVTPQYQSQYKMWLVCLATSHEKLRGNLLEIDKCREEIEVMCAHIHAGLEKTKGQLLQTLEEAKGILCIKIDEAIRETSEHAYLGNYQPISPLASLVWSHSCEQSSGPIHAFTYAVKADIESLQDLLSVSFQTSIAEIASLNSSSQRVDSKQGKEDLPVKLEEQIKIETVLGTSEKELKIEATSLQEAKNPSLDMSKLAGPEGRRVEKRQRNPAESNKLVEKKIKPDTAQFKVDIIKPDQHEGHPQLQETRLTTISPLIPATSASICKTCKQPFTAKDKDWQCANECNCKRCTVALIVAGNYSTCRSCNAAYRKRLRDKVYKKCGRCGSCGGNFHKSKMITHYCEDLPENDELHDQMWDEAMFNDSRCSACFTVNSTLKDLEIQCCVCANTLTVTSEVYPRVKETPGVLQTRACCTFEVGKIPYKKLICGHLICCRHTNCLLRCRACHQIATIAED